MTLSAIFRWKHNDSTVDMNSRLQTLVPRAIFNGGDVTPGSGLTVNVSAFKAIGYDGMLVQDNAVQTLTVVANQTNYVVVRAKYVSGSTPTVQWEVLSQAAYNADPDKNYLIVFAVVTVPFGATSITLSYISTLARDAIDPMQRSPFRGNTVFASLPAVPPEQNRDGDFYFVTDRETFYWWNVATSSWQAFSTGSYNVETGSMADVVIQGERDRIENGSGVVGGVRPADGFASEPDITLIETPSVANQIGFDTFSAVVNGHYVQPYARYVTLPAKPGSGTRYDLIFLEVYREAITVPENHDFPRNPDGSLTYTITEVSDQVEQILWSAGVGGNNFDLNELQADDHSWVVTKYRIGTISGVAIGALQDNQASAASGLNVDGNAFAATPGTGTDERVWMATSTTSSDGYSWAIPLFVVKRTVAEDHTIGQAVQIFRSDVRWVFPVYPVADSAQAARLNVDTTARQQPFNFSTDTPVDYTRPSGFVNGLDYEFTFTDPNKIRIYEDEVRVRIRGLEDNFVFYGGPTFTVSGAPATGYDRVIVYLKMCYTLYNNSTTQTGTMISARHRPLVTDQIAAGTFKGIGWKRGYVTYEFAYYDLGAAATELDEHDAMVSAGWTKGDASLSAIGQQYSDGGVWSKAVTSTTDERIPIFGYEWAIPVCLIHRRNKAAWSWSTNPNGTGAGRPDGKTLATLIDIDETLDLRHQVDIDEARLAELLESDIDKLMRGQLRTRMAERWAGTAGVGGAVAGTRLLQSDHTDGSSNAFRMTAPNGTRKIWSDAKEFVPVAASFDLSGDYGSGSTPVQFTNSSGTLVIRAPAGSYLVRNLPSTFFVDGNDSNTTYLDFNGQPCWSTPSLYIAPYGTPAELKWIDSSAGNPHTEQNVFDSLLGTALESTTKPAFTITASDTLGHATEMSITLADVAGHAVADTMVVSYWVMYDRTPVGSEYVSNWGLAEIPDEVYAVYKDPTGTPEEINIGTLATTVRGSSGGTANVVITSADVLSASGTSGTAAVIVGFDFSSITYSAAPGVTVSSATLSAAQDTLTITYSGALSGSIDVDVVCYYYTTGTGAVTEWVAVGRGGKSVRAYYSWHEEDIDFGGGGASSDYAFDLATAIWHDAEVAGDLLRMPIMWESASSSGPWTWVPTWSAAELVGHRYSNLVSFDANTLTSLQYCKVVVPKWTPPAASAADAWICHYAYTPYQGVSSTGGAVAVPATALPKLKKMLHGTIEANSQHIVTQSGACSLFGGVNSLTGVQARQPQPDKNFNKGNFRQYNQTQLVKSVKANGSIDLGDGSGSADSMYAAAVLRLPFPANPSMITSSLYHNGTMDWDLDPGREGAGAGYFCVAPGYWNGPAYAKMSYGIHYSQFCNGLSRLAVLGTPPSIDSSTMIHTSEFTPYTDVGGTFYYNSATGAWVVGASQVFAGEASLSVGRGEIPLLVITNFGNLDTGDLDSSEANGIRLFRPTEIDATTAYSTYLATAGSTEYTSPITPDGSKPLMICIMPGTAVYYLYSQYMDINPVLRYYLDTTATAVVRSMEQTLVVKESGARGIHPAYGLSGYAYDEDRIVDTIWLPMGSSSVYINNPAGVDHADALSAASLRGRTVQYPASWGATTTTALEGLIAASTIFHSGYGRGLYLGTTTARYNMPVLVPGSGTSLRYISDAENVQAEQTAQPPEQYPTVSSVPAFAPSVRMNTKFDHGGPIGYSFYGVLIRPDDDDYKGQTVMQISGGPIGTATGDSIQARLNSAGQTDGTALDAFFPTHRPLLRAE